MGKTGELDALRMAEATAEELGIEPQDVWWRITGESAAHAMDKIIRIRAAAKEVKILQNKQSQIQENTNSAAEASEAKVSQAGNAARAIMTTDTTVKEMALELPCAAGPVKLGIMAKGSGMIHPNMGTMLCFITTDAQADSASLQTLLREAVDESFNMVTVDGDTSTNDLVLLLANGLSGIKPRGTTGIISRPWSGKPAA
jgi:glutamate N-acetyltransferase/amino-acid N-acetyltransferase